MSAALTDPARRVELPVEDGATTAPAPAIVKEGTKAPHKTPTEPTP